MKIVLEIFLFMGIFFPVYHIFNSFIPNKKRYIPKNNKKVSILIPCYNEGKILQTTIDGINRIEYPKFEVIFVNDGSLDNTLFVLKDVLKLRKTKRKKYHNLNSKSILGIYKSELYPNIIVIDKENGGKSDALNMGINYSKYDYIVTLDADSVLKVNALSKIMDKFNDHSVIAASGVIQIMQSFNLSKINDSTTLKINTLLKLQTLEYIKACFSYKSSLSKLKSLLVISGAFGCFTKDLLLQVNGFKHVIGEDLDITIRIQLLIKNTNYKIAYCPDAICYTEGPETFKDYIKQRKRWQHSFIEGLVNYYKFIYKDTFRNALSFFTLFDFIIIGYLSSLLVIFFSIIIIYNITSNNPFIVLSYFLIFMFINLIYDLTSIIIANNHGIKYKKIDFFRLIYTVFLDIFFYRYVTLYTVILGSLTYLKEHKSWNKVERSGRNYNALSE